MRTHNRPARVYARPLIGLAVIAATATAALAAAGARTWSFEADAAGKPPAGFTLALTAGGKPGRWVVQADKGAPSGGKVLAQLDPDPTNIRYPLAVANEPSPKDLRVSVKCKAISGELDQACGIVFRYRDENNYYVTRANALEGNVRIYFMKDGKRKQIGTWDGAIAAKVWHTLATEAKGDAFRVLWNGKSIIEVKDATFADAGRVGVWTKADSVTHFDDLKIEPL